MKIIMLEGPSNCGKTTVINEVYKILMGKYYSADRHKDFETVIKHGGLTIAIKSDGDFARKTIKAMRECHALGYDILICVNNRGKVSPRREIKKYAHVPPIPKTEPYRNDASCVADAKKIIAFI